MTDKELVSKLIDLVDNQPNTYALGMWGQLLSESIITSKTKQLPSWYTATKQDELRQQIGKKFGFDCVCMIKSILWGWSADRSDKNGGAKYASNGVDDMSADSLVTDKYCTDISEDFSKIVVGEAVWIKGHVGVYIGDGLVVECTPKWKNGCQYTVLDNIKTGLSGNKRKWTKHGKMKFIQYTDRTACSGDSECTKLAASSENSECTKLPTFTPEASSTESSEQAGLTGKDNETKIFNYLVKAGYNKIAASGIMGNIKCESRFKPQNLQGVYETKFNLNDDQYTAKINSGEISREQFYNDHAGYGLAQWTYWSRKKALYDYIMPKYKDISSLIGQCEFLVKELKGYKLSPAELNVYDTVREVSDIIVKVYEKPADQSEAACEKRANAGLSCLNKFMASSEDSECTKSTTNIKKITIETVDEAVDSLMKELDLSEFNSETEVKAFSDWLKVKAGLVFKATIKTFMVRTPANLNIYADYNKSKVTGVIKNAGVYTIVETMNDMGKLKSGAGWIELNKVVRK